MRFRDILTIAAQGVGSGRPWPVFAAAGPRLPEMDIPPTGSRTQYISRTSHKLGGSFSRIKVGRVNAYFGDSGLHVDPPTSFTIQGAKIKGATWSSLVTWNVAGSPTASLVDIGATVESNWLLPAALGLSSFDAGQVIWWDETGTLPSASGRHLVGPIYTYNGGVGSTGFFAIYDPANHIDQLGTAGNMATPTDALLGDAFGAAGFDDETPGAGVPANDMAPGPSYIVGDPI